MKVISTTYKGYKAVISLDSDSKRVDVTLTSSDGMLVDQWHTNDAGEGRFDGDDFTHQTLGTCQYGLRGTPNAIRSKIRKEIPPIIDDWEYHITR